MRFDLYNKDNLDILSEYLKIFEQYLREIVSVDISNDLSWNEKLNKYDRDKCAKNLSGHTIVLYTNYKDPAYRPSLDDFDLAGLCKYFRFYYRDLRDKYPKFKKSIARIHDCRGKAVGHQTKAKRAEYDDNSLFDDLNDILEIFNDQFEFDEKYKSEAQEFIDEVTSLKKYSSYSIENIALDFMAEENDIAAILQFIGVEMHEGEVFGYSNQEIKDEIYPKISEMLKIQRHTKKIMKSNPVPAENITIDQNHEGEFSYQELLGIISNYTVVLDYSALTNKYFADFASGELEKALVSLDKKVFIDGNTRRKLACTTKINTADLDYNIPDEREIIERKELAKHAYKIISSLAKQDLIEERIIDDFSADEDSVFVYLAKNFNENNKLCIITQSEELADQLWSLNRGNVGVCKLSSRDSLSVNKGKESENKEVAIESPTIVTAVEFEEKNDKKAVSEELLVPQLQPIKGTVFSTNKYGEIKLGDIIGDGGEGTVYATQYPQIVAKVYHPDKNTISRKEKIEEMLKISIGSSNICWPIETLCVNGVFVGYIMPAANGKDMSKTVCKPAREGVKGFSNWKRRDLVNTCISVVNLFNELHKHNVFMGDVNPRNFIVNTSDDVFMVDTDSYQIGKRFLCPVGTELFTSPYMHTQMSEEKVGYANIPRSSKDELYALAVMLFLILFTGQPPFSMEGDGSFKSSIMDGNFPYRYKEHATENVPSGVWRYVWSNLDAEVKRLFYEAFVEKKYANEETWNRVLKSYLNNIDAGKSSNDIRPNVYKEIGDTFETISCEMCGSVFNEDKKLYEQRKAEGRPITLCKNCRAFIGLNQKIKYIQKCSECGEEYETTRLKNAEQIDKGYSSVCPECEKEKRSKSFYYRHQSTESVTNFQHYDKAYSLEGTEYKVSENRIFEESLALIEEKYYGFNFEDYKMDSLTDIIVEAEKGKPDYQYLLARKFLFSDNTELDLETVDYTKISESFLDRLVSDSIYSIENIGIEYLRKASEAGVAIATLLLGEYLMQYANDESSYHEVLNTLIPIATMGNSSAQNTIAYAYYKRGASDKARYWLGEAMETRNVQTCYNLFFINYPQLEHLSELIFSNSESPDTNLHRCVATGYYEACVVDICLREIYENNYAYGVASYVSALFPNDALFEAVKCIEEYKKDYQNNYRNINEIYSNFKKLADDGNGLAAYYCYLINMNEPGPFFASKEQQGRYLRIAQELLPQYSSAIENDDNFPKSYFMDMAMSLHKFSYYHSFWKEMCHKCVPDEIAERLKAELLERCQNSDLSSIYVNRELAKACEKSEPEKSISYLEKCVEMGDADALYDIGRLMYSNGDSKAVDYLEEAYKKGNVPAASLYGKIWINKELGCTSMNENASKAIHFACENDDADAYISLGKMYELGYFVEKNLNRALENYNIAISLSNGEKGKIERAFFYMFYTTFLGIDFRKHEGYLLDEYRGGNEAARSALEKFYDRFRPISDSEVKAIEHAYNDLGLLKYEPLMEKCKNYHKLVKRRIAKDKVKRAFAMIGKGIGFLILCAVGPAVVYLLSLMMYKFFADLIGIVIMTFVLLAFASEDTLPIWCLVIIGIVFVIGTIYVVGGIFTFIIAALAGFIIVSFISQFIN